MQYPFEIHITVEGGDVEKFKLACAAANIRRIPSEANLKAAVKPILLELHTQGGMFQDLQTSSVIYGTWVEVREEACRISAVLENHGFKVIRHKIETISYHPSAPSVLNDGEMPPGCYFEAHLAVTTTTEDLPKLQVVAAGHGAHLSRNVFKKLDDQHFTVMLTLRNSVSNREQFMGFVYQLEDTIRELGLDITKVVSEFSIYDTNIKHDDAWLAVA